MIHPAAECRFINDSIGFGVFARRHLPAGTIVYVQDDLDITIPATSPLLQTEPYKRLLETFATVEPDGSRLLSWDIAKHVNHSCNANTLSTAFGFEIAVRPIRAGEQITDDYAQFNLAWNLNCDCGETGCRGIVGAAEFDRLVAVWDERIGQVFPRIFDLPQPLLPILPEGTQRVLREVIAGRAANPSVSCLKYSGPELITG